MNKLIVVLIGILVFNSCSVDKTGFTVRHRKKNIRTNSISNQIKIGYETENAIIYIGQLDAIETTEKKLSGKNLDPRFDKETISGLKNNLETLKKIQKEIIVQHWLKMQKGFYINDYNFASFIDQWLLKELILKGKAEILNKKTNNFEKRIVYHFVRDQLGGEDCFYTFENGVEFHRQLIRLGE